MPRMKKEISSEDVKVGQDEPVDIPTEGDIKREPAPKESDVDIVSPAAVGQAAFYNEKVRVLVHQSADQNNVEPIPMVSVNGRTQFFVRGQPTWVKRKYVAALARAKKTAYRQQVRVDEVTGHVVQRMVPSTAVAYPFSVVDDPNPNGRQWLEKVLAEA